MARPSKAQRLKALATYRVLATRARAVLGQTKLSTRTINALAKAAALSALARTQTLAVAVKASVLVTNAKTGRFFTLLNLEEQLTSSEIRRFSVSKLLQNEAHAVDRALAEVRKALASSAHVADAAVSRVGKRAVDLALLSDTQTAAVGKRLLDTAHAAEQATYDLSTSRADTAHAADATALSPNKRVADTAALSDVLSRTVAFVRFFDDAADATDAINASLLTDDGEVFYLEKRLLDTAGTAEQLNFAIEKTLSDYVEAGDFARVSPSGVSYDVAPTSDTASAEVGLSKSSAAALSDVLAFAQGLTKADSTLTGQVYAQHFYKTVNDVVTAVDQVRFFFEALRSSGVATSEDVQVVRIAAGGVPPQFETQTAADTYQSTLAKTFAELLTVTDDFDGNTTAEDDQTAEFGKNIVQPVSLTELRTVDFARTLPETVGANSSGLLAMTDYCDSTYFSQAYVGTERIFS